MKIRNGFVSNSSSSSFVIKKKHLNEDQIDKIKNHYLHDEYFKEERDLYNAWEVEDNHIVFPDSLYISTFMDNFDMYEFLLKIGVKKEHIQ